MIRYLLHSGRQIRHLKLDMVWHTTCSKTSCLDLAHHAKFVKCLPCHHGHSGSLDDVSSC